MDLGKAVSILHAGSGRVHGLKAIRPRLAVMATLIICPVCHTRYEIAAVIPPEGRKVRCSKCGHVWQAMAVVGAAKPAPVSVPRPPATGARPQPPAPAEPRAAPAEPRAVPAAPEPAPAAPDAAMGAATGFAQQPSAGGTLGGETSPGPGTAPSFAASPGAGAAPSFAADETFQADAEDEGRASPAAGWPEEGLGAGSWPEAAPQPGAPQAFGSYDSGALVNPAERAQPDISIGGEGARRRAPSTVALGWGLLALLLGGLLALVILAPKAVVSALPGAARLYAMVRMPVSARGLDIQDVHYAWNDAGGNPVLTVVGNVVNLTAGDIAVPPVEIALQDEAGRELTVVTAGVAPLAAGARAPFAAQIPSPPDSLRRIKVRFAKAS
jgi:predicted Zn finger-like uncharacterized protein